MIRFACPQCQMVLQAAAEQARATVACPRCESQLPVPSPAPEGNAGPRTTPVRPTVPTSRSLLGSYTLFAALGLIDLGLTCYLLRISSGHIYESNPLAQWRLARWGWAELVGFKLVLLALATAAIALVARRRPRPRFLLPGHPRDPRLQLRLAPQHPEAGGAQTCRRRGFPGRTAPGGSRGCATQQIIEGGPFMIPCATRIELELHYLEGMTRGQRVEGLRERADGLPAALQERLGGQSPARHESGYCVDLAGWLLLINSSPFRSPRGR
jgi:hypothetical protein